MFFSKGAFFNRMFANWARTKMIMDRIKFLCEACQGCKNARNEKRRKECREWKDTKNCNECKECKNAKNEKSARNAKNVEDVTNAKNPKEEKNAKFAKNQKNAKNAKVPKKTKNAMFALVAKKMQKTHWAQIMQKTNIAKIVKIAENETVRLPKTFTTLAFLKKKRGFLGKTWFFFKFGKGVKIAVECVPKNVISWKKLPFLIYSFFGQKTKKLIVGKFRKNDEEKVLFRKITVFVFLEFLISKWEVFEKYLR